MIPVFIVVVYGQDWDNKDMLLLNAYSTEEEAIKEFDAKLKWLQEIAMEQQHVDLDFLQRISDRGGDAGDFWYKREVYAKACYIDGTEATCTSLTLEVQVESIKEPINKPIWVI